VGVPVLALASVFVLGLICAGLIGAAGGPSESSAEPMQVSGSAEPTPESTPPAQPEHHIPSLPTPTLTRPAQPYISPGGTSPLPKYGEAETRPIPPVRLIDDAEFNAPPPPEIASLPAPAEPVDWTQAHQYVGQVITVRGTIVNTNNIGQICFLNFDTNWQDKFYVAMFKEAFDLLPDPPETHYLNKTLLITGKVTLHRGRPQIEVHDLSQIEVVE